MQRRSFFRAGLPPSALSAPPPPRPAYPNVAFFCTCVCILLHLPRRPFWRPRALPVSEGARARDPVARDQELRWSRLFLRLPCDPSEPMVFLLYKMQYQKIQFPPPSGTESRPKTSDTKRPASWRLFPRHQVRGHPRDLRTRRTMTPSGAKGLVSLPNEQTTEKSKKAKGIPPFAVRVGKPTNGLLPDGQAASGTRGKADKPPDGQAASGTRGKADQRTPPRWPGSLRDPRESRPTTPPRRPGSLRTRGKADKPPRRQAASGTRGNADQPPRRPGSLRTRGKADNLPDGQAASGTRGNADQPTPPRRPGSLRDPRESRPTDSSPMARQPQGPEGMPTNLPDGQVASGTRGKADKPPRRPGSLRDPRESRQPPRRPGSLRDPRKADKLPDGQAASGTRGKADKPPRRPGSLRDPRESRPTSPTARQPQGPEESRQPPPRWPGSLRDPRESRPTDSSRRPGSLRDPRESRKTPRRPGSLRDPRKADQTSRRPGSLRDPRESRQTSPMARQPQGPEGKPTNRLLPDGQAASGTRGKADQPTPPRRPGSLRDPRESRPTDSSRWPGSLRDPRECRPTSPDGQAASGTRGKPTNLPEARQPQGPEGKPTNRLLPDGQAASGTRGKADQPSPRQPQGPRESRPTDSSPMARQPQGPEGKPTNGLLPDGQAASGTRGKADKPPRRPGSLTSDQLPDGQAASGTEGKPTNLPKAASRGKADQPTHGQAASGTRGPYFAIQSKSRWQSWPV
ncbi:putative serine/arginine repetitive matrix protein 5-like [Penaeus vannamei]|uniref:Putative serine/arginine repetitive matrix protein 5-like n=1 Tax=Penaeus vannamei TaxID=6689 RepID=A0A3R7QEX8_PENVA|nr:putative serine/arginine repetitive matrix protein 5-like [Penaeus vannamei]